MIPPRMTVESESELQGHASAPRVRPIALFLAFVALLNFPNLNFDLEDLFWIDGWGPDPSMFVALHMAVRDGLQFGRDVIFTYGPLGYLTFAVYVDDTLWIQAVIYQLAAHTLLFSSLFLLLRRQAVGWWQIFAVGAVTSVFLQAIGGWLIDLKLLVALLVFCHLRLTSKRDGPGSAWRDGALGLLAAVPLYIKFSGGVTAILIVGMFIVLLLSQRQLLRAGAVLGAYVATAATLGLHLVGSFDGIGAFLDQSLEIASTYVDAVALEGPVWQLSLGIISGAAYLSLLDRARREGDRAGVSFLLLASGLCLAAFKHGFVRHDAHVAGFFAVWMMVATLFLVVAVPDWRSSSAKLASRFALGLAFVTAAMVFLNSGDFFFHRIFTSMPVDFRNISRFVTFVTQERPAFLAADPEERRSLMRDALAKVPDSNLASDTLDRIGSGTLDIFPWDVAIAERFGLRWRPRPMFQSYSAFSDRLDAGNAEHFVGGTAPDYVLYGHRSVDGRCPTFDEPRTFRTLLTGYRALARDEAFVLLERIHGSTPPAETPIGSVESSLGEEVAVPRSTSGYVFARVHVDYSWLGRLVRVIYKPPPVFIRLSSSDMAIKYRLVPSTAKNGLFVSRYVLGPRDLLDVWSGELGQNLDAISIVTDSPSFFADAVSVEFFEIPYPVRAQPNWKVECSAEDEITRDGQHAIGVLQGDHIDNWQQPVLLERSEPLVISGWAIDEQGEALAGNVFVLVDGMLMAPTDYERFREDVAAYFENDAYTYSGWSANLDLQELSDGLHKITLRVISQDGKRCYEPKRGVRIYVHD
jgi:hypothetical protein